MEQGRGNKLATISFASQPYASREGRVSEGGGQPRQLQVDLGVFAAFHNQTL